MLFQDKVVLITGAASGIGRTVALAFAAAGARLVLSDVNDTGGAETLSEISAMGCQAIYERADVSDSAQVDTLMAAALARFGRVDYGINNAGISGSLVQRLHEIDESLYDQIIDINVKGVWLCMRAELRLMIEQGSGAIVNLSSVAGMIGAPKASVYSASKHAVIGLTRSAALEYAKHNIRVNAVCPSYTETPMVTSITDESPMMQQLTTNASPMKRLAQPEEIATAILWLCSSEASYVNGIILPVDGGLTAS